MGTRSTITFIEKWNEEVTPITTVYQQYDGYLDGVGYTLAKWLSGKVIINGIPEYRKEYANEPFLSQHNIEIQHIFQWTRVVQERH